MFDSYTAAVAVVVVVVVAVADVWMNLLDSLVIIGCCLSVVEPLS